MGMGTVIILAGFQGLIIIQLLSVSCEISTFYKHVTYTEILSHKPRHFNCTTVEVTTKKVFGDEVHCGWICSYDNLCLVFSTTGNRECVLCFVDPPQTSTESGSKAEDMLNNGTMMYSEICDAGETPGMTSLNNVTGIPGITSVSLCGVQFMGLSGSFLLYDKAHWSSIEFKYEIRFYLKTNSSDGMMMYSKKDVDYMAFYLSGGQIVHRFNNGGSDRMLQNTTRFYNDDRWHELVFVKDGQNGFLTVDDEVVPMGTTMTNFGVDTDGKYYVGGVPSNVTIPDWIMSESKGIVGCIKHLYINGEPAGEPEVKGNVGICQ